MFPCKLHKCDIRYIIWPGDEDTEDRSLTWTRHFDHNTQASFSEEFIIGVSSSVFLVAVFLEALPNLKVFHSWSFGSVCFCEGGFWKLQSPETRQSAVLVAVYWEVRT